MKYKYGIFKTIVRFIGIFSSIVGVFWFALYLGGISIHYIIEFVLLFLCIILLITVLKLKHNYAKLAAEHSKREESHYKNFALTFYTNPDPLMVDCTHKLDIQEEHDEITNQDAFLSFRFQGVNTSSSPSHFIREEISDEIPIEFNNLEFTAIDNRSKMALSWKVIKDLIYAKIIEIYFTYPLLEGESFDISFSYKLLGSFKKGDDDYVFYPVHFYKKGVNKLITTLSLDSPPINYELLRFDGKEFITEVQPKLEIANDRATIKLMINNPKGIYLLRFRRQNK